MFNFSDTKNDVTVEGMMVIFSLNYYYMLFYYFVKITNYIK